MSTALVRRARRPRSYGSEPLEPRLLLSTISGVKWRDVDGDGVRDARTDTPLAGWTIYADLNNDGSRGAAEPSAQTAADGTYTLTVTPAPLGTTFHVREAPQAGWRPTNPDTGERDVLVRGTTNPTGIDFGNTQRAQVSGTLFNDANENGRQDLFERGLSGWTVFADANGDGALNPAEASAVTDASGNYALTLPAGSYTIRQVLQPGWLQTAPASNGGYPVTLAAAQILAARDFGDVAATYDLTGNGFAVVSASQPVPADGHVDVQYGVRNDGNADSPSFVVGFYLSDDSTITTADTLVGLRSMTVPRHGAASGADTFSLPAPDPFRTDNEYFVGMVVDVANAVPETDETNNANRGGLIDQFPVTSEADLPRPVNGTAVQPRDVTISTTVTSALGDEWVGGYDVDVYRFTAQAGHRLVLSLQGPAGAMVSLYDTSWTLRGVDAANVAYAVPATGTYYAVVSSGPNSLDDPRRLTGRSSEPTGPYTLGVGAVNLDLELSGTVSALVNPPAPIHANFFIRVSQFDWAAPGATIPPFDVSFYLSDDQHVGGSDVLLQTVRLTYGDFRVDASRQGYPVSVDIALPPVEPFLTDNQYWIRAVADAGGEVPEGDETNNIAWFSPATSERSLPSPVDGQRVLPGFLNVGAIASAVIGDEWVGPYDQDVYSGAANPNETVDFDLDRAAGSSLDAYMRLYDADWNLLDASDNAAAPFEPLGVDPFIRHTFVEGGKYFVVISGAGNQAGDPRRLAGRSATSTGGYDLAARTNPAGPVTGVVFDDSNANGVRDPSEPGLAGWTVFLDPSNDGFYTETFGHATTDPTGAFSITGVRPGTYYLHRVEPDGWQGTAPASSSYRFTVGTGEAAGPFVFGDVHRPTVTGAVYDDANENGVRDAGESGLAGRTVYADLNHNGVRDTFPMTVDFPGLPLTGDSINLLLDIPDQGPFEIADVNVAVAFSEVDPRITITAPGGAVTLRLPNGQQQFISFNGSFDDEAAFPMQSFGGSGPVRPQSPLAALDGTKPGGKWYLFIASADSFGFPSRVLSAAIELTLAEPSATTDDAGRYTFNQLLPGSYTIRAEDEADRLPTAPRPAAYDRTLAEGQTADGLDFGRRLRRLQIIGRHVFYNNSAFDGRNAAIGEADDRAIAPDKSFLPAVQTPGAANVTSYAKGINGIMVDVAELPTAPTLADYSFKVPSGFSSSVWLDAPAPTGFAVRDLPGGDHLRRVTFTWPDNLLRNTWLQVGVLADAATRRLAPDLAYIANLVGESGVGPGLTRVDAADLVATRAAASGARAAIDNPFDLNRDGWLNVRDVDIVRGNLGRALPSAAPPQSAAIASASPARRSAPTRRTDLASGLLDEQSP